MNATAQSILDQFNEAGLHSDLSPEDRATLAAELANLERQGYVVDLETCQILEDVSPDQPVALTVNVLRAARAGVQP